MAHQHPAEIERTIKHIQGLLNRQGLVEALLHKQEQQPKQALVESVTLRQHLNEIRQLIQRLHPSDIAFLIEQIPPQQRELVWQQVDTEQAGAVLLELPDSICNALLDEYQSEDLLAMASHLDSDEIADLVQELPQDVVPDLLSALPPSQRKLVTDALNFPEDTVGAWMEFDMPVVRDDIKLDVVLRYFRRLGRLPDSSGRIMVVDDNGNLKGTLSTEDLVVRDGDLPVAEVLQKDPIVFHTRDNAEEAARVFERYELLVAPVTNLHGKLVGVLRVSSLLDLISDLNHRKILAQAGLSREENLFDPVWKSARNRWPWILLNLAIVFLASRIIDQFADTISQVVALAALLPITANIGGNAGNQVVALVIRGLATKQLDQHNTPLLFIKELSVAMMNGVIWGCVIAFLTLLLYQNPLLSLVIGLAMLFTMLIAALIGVCIPLLLKRLKQDPAMGSSIILTGCTDTLGFLIFLALAAMIL